MFVRYNDNKIKVVDTRSTLWDRYTTLLILLEYSKISHKGRTPIKQNTSGRGKNTESAVHKKIFIINKSKYTLSILSK